jgi:protein gp37
VAHAIEEVRRVTTAIEWTEETWNPTVGCSRVSPGCDGCYAISVAHRAMQPAHEGLTIRRPGERTDWTGTVRCLPERLDVPLRRRKPTMWFVDSMSDLFHPDVPNQFVVDVFITMARARRHTFQVLTKRPQRMAELLHDPKFSHEMYYGLDEFVPGDDDALETLCEWQHRDNLPNVWLGTSIESDRYAFRADHLRDTPAAVRFLSLEPLLGPLPSLDLSGIDWVIVGGESGPGARPMHPDWVRDIRDRCVAAGIPFFFKQWGAWAPYLRPFDYVTDDDRCQVVDVAGRLRGRPWGGWKVQDGTRDAVVEVRYGKKAAGRVLDGRTWDEMPGRAP